MSWEKTYSHTVALGLDRLGAALIFNEPDITISSLCWVVRTPSAAVIPLKLSGWQYRLLLWIGDRLEQFWPGHCADARGGDLDTSARSRLLLGAKKEPAQ